MQDDNEERLSARIRAAEHRIYPHAIGLFQEGRLEVDGRKVIIKDLAPGAEGQMWVNPPLR
jgi:phosphoribosylglycinamide formyltransferase-1